MGLIKNAINFGNGFNIGAMGPIDARMRVEHYSDLTSAWNSSTPAYLGMIVTVMDTNDVYVLNDADNWDLETSWSKLAKASDVKGDAAALEERFNEHVSANTTSFNNVNQTIQLVSGDVVTLSNNTTSSFTETNSKIDVISGNVNTISGDVETLKTSVNTISDDVSQTKAMLDGFGETQSSVKTYVDDGIAHVFTSASTYVDDLIGEVPSDKTVIELIDEAKEAAVAAGTKLQKSADEEFIVLNEQENTNGSVTYTISTVDVASASGVNETLKLYATKAELEAEAKKREDDDKLLADEISGVSDSVTTLASNLGGRVDSIEQNYATKAELQSEADRAKGREDDIESALTAVTARVEAFLDNTELASSTLDSLIELQEYITADSAHTQTFIQGIADNKRDIALVSAKTETDRTALEGLVATEINKVTTALTATEGRLDARIQTVETGLTSVNSRVDTVNSNLEQEIKDRKNADSALTQSISAETSARETAINEVKGLISAETSARESAITEVRGLVSAETSARESAITEVNGLISAETSARETAITEVRGLVSAETSARESEITEVKGLISAETSARESEIERVEGLISAETSARETAINELSETISDEFERINGVIEENERVVAESLNDLNSNKVSVEDFNTSINNLNQSDVELGGRITTLESVKVTGSQAIVVSQSDAKLSKEISLKLDSQPENGGVVLSQNDSGLSATMQWGEF